MSALSVVLILIIVLAIPLAVWLKREGEKSWRAHRQYVLTRETREAFIRFQIQIADNFTPAMRQVGIAAQKCAAEMARLGVALREDQR